MSTPTTATATVPPHYRHPHHHHHHHHHPHHPHHSQHHQHYPLYPHLSTSTTAAAGGSGASTTTAAASASSSSSTYRPATTTTANPLLPTSTSTASTATGSNRRHSNNHQPQPYLAGQQQTNGVVASVASTRPLAHDPARTHSSPRSDVNSNYPNHDHPHHPQSEMAPAGGNATVTAQAQTHIDPHPRKRRRSKGPDWNSFYKNGLPKEIIVIDDSPDPDQNPSASASSRTYTTVAVMGSATEPTPRHVTKKRRKDDVHRPNGAHDTRANGAQNYASNTGSTSADRTASAQHTTAPTSLGSLSSNGQYEYDAASHTGQKRKRTRQQIAQETLNGTYATYRPPQKPVKKAPEVKVRQVDDRSHQSNIRVDDDDGHYIVVPDADLTSQYQISNLLGQGTFGKVVKARDRKRNKLVAIKIIRAVQKYRDASRIELRVLQTLKANDEENRNRCIHLRDCFDYRGHICIVMDLLGSSVFDFLKSNNFVPFPNSQIQNFARQLFTSVAFLHDLNLIHTDLKPENILLCDSAYQTFTYNRRIPSSSATVNRQATQRKVLLDTEIRLIDFGSATFQDEYHSSVVSTRHYRAPEIILGLGWSFPCDIWSIGCILVEFFTGDALFQTHDNLEHLAMMENVCDSRIDSHLVQSVNRMASRSGGNPASKYFKRLRLDYPTTETTRASKRFVKNMKRLSDIIPATSPFLRSFLDLLQRIFVYDPAKRITAPQALDHPWLREPAIPDDGTEAAKIRMERMRDHHHDYHTSRVPVAV
ncbi:protein kinase-like domain-containing protein [Xylariomycetidae sp. FL2044]|nr:protein kinase-like domain-containing protein [Xylariomycetidae sp. FL2044]